MSLPNSYENRLTQRIRRADVLLDEEDKKRRMLEALLDPADTSVTSLRECYIQITGDTEVTGLAKDVDLPRFESFARAHLLEAVDSSTWANIFGQALNRRMVHEYQNDERFQTWRKVVNIRQTENFRTHTHIWWGGYGDLPIVSQGVEYGALTTPPYEETTFGIVKRGGTETVTFEAFRNDEVGAVQKIPKRLAEAAHRTLGRFVFNFIKDNAVLPIDGLPLFHTSRKNLGTAPLSAAAAVGALNAIRRAPDLLAPSNHGDPLRLEGRRLFVAYELEEFAYNLFVRGTNNDPTWLQRKKLDVVPVWYWTDADDWCVSVDPADFPTIEVSFLDAREDPELILQDLPIGGSLFSRDQLTYKIRHVYGGAPVSWRGMYKSQVA